MKNDINPLISIVTVSYNAVSTIEQTILSVINQTYSNIEYIIIDGGSTDGTVDVIKKYQDRVAFWVSEPDKGIYDAMNKGMGFASGNFLFYLGADDILFDSKVINRVSSKMETYDNVYYGDVYINKIRKLYWGKFSSSKLAMGNICHQAIFYPQQVYQNTKYELKYKVYADYVYNILIYPNVKFIYLDETISVFNYGGFSAKNIDNEFEKDINLIVIRNLGLFPFLCRWAFNVSFCIKNYIKRLF